MSTPRHEKSDHIENIRQLHLLCHHATTDEIKLLKRVSGVRRRGPGMHRDVN